MRVFDPPARDPRAHSARALFDLRAPGGRLLLAVCALALAGAGCSEDSAPGRTYYQRNIEPTLLQSCAGNVVGCHSTNEEDPYAFAAGNLDVTSFENIQKRRDLLEPFGVYPVPLMLIKAVGSSDELQVAYGGDFETLEIQHAGGSILQVGSEAYLTLLRWMENGATESGLAPPSPGVSGIGACSSEILTDFDPAPYMDSEFFDQFVSEVQPILSQSCASGSCHGAPQSDFYLTCGNNAQQQAYNFSQVQAFVDVPADNSPLLQYPLAIRSGGYFHTGGEFFNSRNDGDYQTIQRWADSVGPVAFGADDPGRQFFADEVQPLLLRRGCHFESCHSPAAINDFKLRPGSQGFFSAVALEKNYEIMRDDFMALEVPDARRGRAVAKGILKSFGGIAHRGGPVLETPGSGGSLPENCPDPYQSGFSAFCTVQEWVRIEREALLADDQVLAMTPGSTVPIVYVDRAETHVASPLEFDTYQPSSDLRVADATLGDDGSVTAVGAPRSLLDNCPGATDRGVVDVRGPDVRLDGTTVAFAMRLAVDEALSIYTVDLDGQNCQRLTGPAAAVDGILPHDFDPAWSPDGEYIVFASSRGGDAGPSLSRKLFLPQSDIWRMRPDGSEPEQMTYLTNSELSPQFMREGRVIMSTEKISAGFYQVAGRRINWDLTDYHPLLAQRAESPFADLDDPAVLAPSVGYAQATELREGFDGDFLLVLSDEGARGGAGTLAIFNRSVGPFEDGRDDPGFLASMTLPDPAATGRVGAMTSGAYRSPFSLPDGRIMASYAAFEGDLGTATSLGWDIVAVDPRSGDRTLLIGGDGAQVEAVLALKHPSRNLYYNRRQLVFGGGVDPEETGGIDFGVIHIPDVPVIFTLLNANLRRGRPVGLFDEATHLAAYQELPAPPGTNSGSGEGGIFEQRTFLGRARLAADGSVKVRAPAGTPLILELQKADGTILETMREEHQVGPGEYISVGVPGELFDAVCGGCHGSLSGRELDAAITADVLTGASESLSAEGSAADFSP
ncbi:hypothetical protein [Haliangium sp.]|uniref:HzsA-related protein n=1 Tax=Haliangium sp. TaxID=2663208 RepID=UPI003D148F77